MRQIENKYPRPSSEIPIETVDVFSEATVVDIANWPVIDASAGLACRAGVAGRSVTIEPRGPAAGVAPSSPILAIREIGERARARELARRRDREPQDAAPTAVDPSHAASPGRLRVISALLVALGFSLGLAARELTPPGLLSAIQAEVRGLAGAGATGRAAP